MVHYKRGLVCYSFPRRLHWMRFFFFPLVFLLIEWLNQILTLTSAPLEIFRKPPIPTYYQSGKVLVAQRCLIFATKRVVSLPSTLPCTSAYVISPCKNTGLGNHFLLQGIFLTQGLNRVSNIEGIYFSTWAIQVKDNEDTVYSIDQPPYSKSKVLGEIVLLSYSLITATINPGCKVNLL